MDKINFIIHFDNGSTFKILPAVYDKLNNSIVAGTVDYQFFDIAETDMTLTRFCINLKKITHITQEKSLDQASSYVPPKEPNEIKEEKEKQRVERISDLGAVIESHKEKEDES